MARDLLRTPRGSRWSPESLPPTPTRTPSNDINPLFSKTENIVARMRYRHPIVIRKPWSPPTPSWIAKPQRLKLPGALDRPKAQTPPWPCARLTCLILMRGNREVQANGVDRSQTTRRDRPQISPERQVEVSETRSWTHHTGIIDPNQSWIRLNRSARKPIWDNQATQSRFKNLKFTQ